MKKIKVFDLVGKNAISMSSGEKLFNEIGRHLKRSEIVLLDFEGVELFASPFFNASIGLTLKDISIDELKTKIQIENLNRIGLDLLNLVIDNAIKFYSDGKVVENAIDSVKKNREI